MRLTIRGEEASTVGCFALMVGVPLAVGLGAMATGAGSAGGLLCLGGGLLPLMVIVAVQYLTSFHLVVTPRAVRYERWVGPWMWRREAAPLAGIAKVYLRDDRDMVLRMVTLESRGGGTLEFIADGHEADDCAALVAFLEEVVAQARSLPRGQAERPPPQALLDLLGQGERGPR